ncbi:MAG: hypothetical protein ACOZQL_02595 [Myxococcota bacterium]
MGHSHESDPKKLPVPFKPRESDLVHHQKEWTSGARGGGSVPKDFTWRTNPKQSQEEHGSPALDEK